MGQSGSTEGVYGLRYLTVVAIATVVVASLALLVRNREAALGAAVLGIYALHLLSVRYVLRNQRRHQDSLRSQMELLHRLVDPAASPVDQAPETPESPDPKPAPDPEAPGRAAVGREPDAVDARAPARPETAPAPRALSRRHPAASRVPAPAPAPGTGPAPGIGPVSANGAPASPGGAGVREAGPPSSPSGPTPGDSGEIPIPRHFALGTVALIRELLTPAEVARVLMEQRRQPDRRFATLAVEMGLLTDSEREELLLAQQEGLFTEQEMREARERLREFRESTAKAMSDLD